MSRTPLNRPAPPEGPRVRRARTVAIFGEGDAALAEALLEHWPEARRVDVALRHAAGATRTGDRLDAHPDAVRGALDAMLEERRDTPVVGVGGAFAALVEPSLAVFSGPASVLLGLSGGLREAAKGAHLQLDTPRLGAMAALARAIRRQGFPS